MKLSLNFCLLALFCLFVTSSCKKEIDYHPEWSKSSMSGKVDGVLLECTVATAQTYVYNGQTTMQIVGNKGLSGFSLTIDNFKGTGTYSFAVPNIGAYTSGVAGLQDMYLGNSTGTVKITSYLADQYIKGTFEFKGENASNSTTKTITEGQFNINLVPVKLPETNNSTNNLNVSVDGVVTGFATVATLMSTPLGKVLTISGVNGDKRINISIISYKGLGTYDIANDGVGAYMKDQTPTGSFYADSGKLVITSEAGNKLKGTFSFKGGNQDARINTSVELTAGSFEVPFSK